MAKKSKFTAQEIIDVLRKECDNPTIEGELLRNKLTKEMYKLVGEPTEQDFKSEFKHASCWTRYQGYTTYIGSMTEEQMTAENKSSTTWRIQRPSKTKLGIVDDYTKDGWSCEVQAYNVICTKYVKHPRYDGLWVRFRCSRDTSKYELILER